MQLPRGNDAGTSSGDRPWSHGLSSWGPGMPVVFSVNPPSPSLVPAFTEPLFPEPIPAGEASLEPMISESARHTTTDGRAAAMAAADQPPVLHPPAHKPATKPAATPAAKPAAMSELSAELPDGA